MLAENSASENSLSNEDSASNRDSEYNTSLSNSDSASHVVLIPAEVSASTEFNSIYDNTKTNCDATFEPESNIQHRF